MREIWLIESHLVIFRGLGGTTVLSYRESDHYVPHSASKLVINLPKLLSTLVYLIQGQRSLTFVCLFLSHFYFCCSMARHNFHLSKLQYDYLMLSCFSSNESVVRSGPPCCSIKLTIKLLLGKSAYDNMGL